MMPSSPKRLTSVFFWLAQNFEEVGEKLGIDRNDDHPQEPAACVSHRSTDVQGQAPGRAPDKRFADEHAIGVRVAMHAEMLAIRQIDADARGVFSGGEQLSVCADHGDLENRFAQHAPPCRPCRDVDRRAVVEHFLAEEHQHLVEALKQTSGEDLEQLRFVFNLENGAAFELLFRALGQPDRAKHDRGRQRHGDRQHREQTSRGIGQRSEGFVGCVHGGPAISMLLS
jgi:hypothetical protein